jgi:hypothetical protein
MADRRRTHEHEQNVKAEATATEAAAATEEKRSAKETAAMQVPGLVGGASEEIAIRVTGFGFSIPKPPF